MNKYTILDNRDIDLSYNPESENAQSGKAVNEAINIKPGIKTLENGEIFNDYENNMAYGEFTHAEGEGTTVGCTGYLITNIEKVIILW